MRVPSIDDLERLFRSQAESVAEVGVGRVLSLDEWPSGEVRLVATVAGRSATVLLNPSADSIAIELVAADPVVRLDLVNVVEVRAARAPGDVRSLVIVTGPPTAGVSRLLLAPDIRVELTAG